MSNFHVGLKKVVDDSYDIEIGYGLEEKLVNDLKNGLVGGLHKFAVVTDDIVKDLHAEKICNLLIEAGFTAQLFVFPNGEKSKVRKRRRCDGSCRFCGGNIRKRNPVFELRDDTARGGGCVDRWKDRRGHTACDKPDRAF